MSMPSDVTPDITEAMEADNARPGERLISQFTLQQQGWIAAALITFVGVAYLGPALTRLMTPKSRAEKLREEMTLRAREAKARARSVMKRSRKTARRLGGGTIWR